MFNGSMDEIAVYNRSLTASEVQQLYLRTWYDYSPQQFLLHPNYPEELSNNTGNTTLLLRFNDGVGTAAADSSPYGNSGNISGASFTNDSISGSALSFDGTNDYVNVSSKLDVANGITMEVWIKYNGGDAGEGRSGFICDKYYGECWYGLYVQGSTREVGINMFQSTPAALETVEAIPLNEWTHLAGTIDAQNAKFYINGQLKTVSAVTTLNVNGGAAPIIGADGNTYFSGLIDEVWYRRSIDYLQRSAREPL